MYHTTTIIAIIACLSQVMGSIVPKTNDGSRIIGGIPATIQTFPYAVQVNLNNQLVCGGTLLSRRCVLSAAHCFVERNNPTPNPRLYSVRVGSDIRNSGGSTHRISSIVVHPSYNVNTQDSDVAIMVLNSRVTLSQSANIATIPQPGYSVPENATITVIGWGNTHPNTSSLATTLQQVRVEKVNHTTCVLRYASLRQLVTRNMICAGLLDVGGADACQGDSGGPMIQNDMIVGIVSWGYGCALPHYPGVGVRVANFASWINVTVTNNPACRVSSTSTLMPLFFVMALLFASNV